MSSLPQDLRFAARSLRKSPVFTCVVVLSLALGIGANTAIFTLTDQILLRLLPVREPRQLVQFKAVGPHIGNNRGDPDYTFSYPMYLDLRDRAPHLFQGVMTRFSTRANVRAGEAAESLPLEFISGNYFQTLGVAMAVGRPISAEDDQQGKAAQVAVLGYEFFKERFGRDPGVVGRTMLINSHRFQIIGVSQEGFTGVDGTASVAVRVPMGVKGLLYPSWGDLDRRRSTWAHVFARLQPGVTPGRAQAEFAGIYHNFLREETRSSDFDGAPAEARAALLTQRFEVAPAAAGFSRSRPRVEQPLRILTVLVALVLLIACANVAGLLLARAASRRKEIAVRLAMGASRAQLLRQLLTESLVLALLGGTVGILLSIWSAEFLVRFLTLSETTIQVHTNPDTRILAFTAGLSVLTGVLFGFVPAWQATRVRLAETLKDQAASVTAGRAQLRLRKLLVSAQVALSLLLLVGAGLFARSLAQLRNSNPGFDTARVIAFSVDPTLNAYDTNRSQEFYRRLLTNLRALPGVEQATITAVRVLANDQWDSDVTVEGYTLKPHEGINPMCNAVGAGYFKTLGLPLIAGREFDERDATGHYMVAMVNRAFAVKYFGTENAVGRRIALGAGPTVKPDAVIIGVTADARYKSMRDSQELQVFWPYERFAKFLGGMDVLVRTTSAPEALFQTLRQEVARIDPALPVTDLRTIEEQRNLSLVLERLLASLAAAFSLLATLLAALGLYSILAFVVQSRTREIGIRMALGAGQPRIAGMMARELLLLVAGGAAVGLAAAVMLARFVSSQLYGIEPLDPFAFLLATGALVAVAALAGLIPSWRASRIDPIHALHYE